jgi:hypothetical protein
MILDLIAVIDIVDGMTCTASDIDQELTDDIFDLVRVNGLSLSCDIGQIRDRQAGDNL